MTEDEGELILVSCREDLSDNSISFYDRNGKPVYFSRLDEPMARIKYILPVKLRYLGNEATGVLPIGKLLNYQNLAMLR